MNKTNKNFLALLRIKLFSIKKLYTRFLWRILGMKIGYGGSIGRIYCNWPNKIVIGVNSVLEDDITFKITKPFDNDNYVNIGDNVFIGTGCEFNCSSQIIIKANSQIASNTTFVDTTRSKYIKGENLNSQPVISSPITIGEDVWIGTKSVILTGVIIGNGSIIGAGSVVNKSIPSNQIWAGVPAKFIKERQ